MNALEHTCALFAGTGWGRPAADVDGRHIYRFTEGMALELCSPDGAALVLCAPVCAVPPDGAARDDLLLRAARLVPAMFRRHAAVLSLDGDRLTLHRLFRAAAWQCGAVTDACLVDTARALLHEAHWWRKQCAAPAQAAASPWEMLSQGFPFP